MDKKILHERLISTLETLSQNAADAALQAHDTATNKECVAENKYDTFGLEASYLAQGQAKRVAECEADLHAYRLLSVVDFEADAEIELGALIKLVDESAEQYLFLGPVAGGIKLSIEGKEITIITPSSPLGKALIGCTVGDEVTLADKANTYTIVSIL